jgi:hypothetical protein
MSRYTFSMSLLGWIVVLAAAGALLYWLQSWRERRADRERASEQRFAALLSQATASGQADPDVGKQRLLFDAAAKAAEAGEPVLAMQLYARLIARFPHGQLTERARLAVEEQKRALARP